MVNQLSSEQSLTWSTNSPVNGGDLVYQLSKEWLVIWCTNSLVNDQ